MAARALNRNELQKTSSAKSVADFEIILQEDSLGNSLLKLLKLFCAIEKDGRQS